MPPTPRPPAALLTLPPAAGTPPPGLPGATARLVALVREGSAGRMFPPVLVPGPDGVLAPDRELRGSADADRLAALLATDDFRPLRDALGRLEDWCARTAPRYRSELASGVLTVANPGLFGPLVAELFTVCAAGRPATAHRFAAERTAQCQEFLALFLTRLRRDMDAGAPGGPVLPGPVTALRADGEETHNGGQRVLRLTGRDGTEVAYKPRPATGEALFLAETGSLFALLNSLPAASGPIRLPVLGCRTGPAEDPGYSWQEWVAPPAERGTLRSDGRWRMTGTVLSPERAQDFWHRAGALTAVCFGLGIADLTGDNLLAGSRPGDDGPFLYPVDMEAYFARLYRLNHSGLVFDPDGDGYHHVGLESEARWCGPGGPVLYWRPLPDGGLALHRRTGPVLRTETRSVVGDTEGRTGYGPYLPAMLRGMFDAWTLLGRHRAAVRTFVAGRAAREWVRVIPQRTAAYSRALGERLWPEDGGAPGHRPAHGPGRGPTHGPDGTGTDNGDPGGFRPDELRQLELGDVPYFFRSADGGPLLRMMPPPGPFRTAPAETRSRHDLVLPPVPAVREGANLTLAGLGIALRDAVEYVAGQETGRLTDDADHRVLIRLRGPEDRQVGFAWPEVGRRITYRWNTTKVRLSIEELRAPVTAP
ncbi:hypothetical protein GCM10009716_17490 [Streptomyces sodiiphilus]|uniref:Lantibiotic biosynthesis protein dehydration domain-containing protein n=1 Tax=Streptomyces sodiiphilus TaxID=226217 RepID=A0ABN2P0M9_9ACTN